MLNKVVLAVVSVEAMVDVKPGWFCSTFDDSFATSVASGLLNRWAGRPFAKIDLRSSDRKWLEASAAADPDGVGQTVFEDTDGHDLIALAVSTGAARGAVLYNRSEEYAIPTVATLCGIHQALPVNGDVVAAAAMNLTVVFDARGQWSNVNKATDYAISELMPQSSTRAVVLQSPDLLLGGFLSDFVASDSLLAVWPEAPDEILPTLCIDFTPAHKAWKRIVAGDAALRWDGAPFPTVMGYHPTGQGVAECVSLCTSDHRALTLVSDFSSNLAFHTRVPFSVVAPAPAPPPALTYDTTKTYVALVVSDGDNLQFDFGGARDMLEDRIRACAVDGECPPLAWTLSNRLMEYGPDALDWFHKAATAQDAFLMGPSGYGYIYPGYLSTEDQRLHARNTAKASSQLGWPGYVHWDWAGTSTKSYFQALVEESDAVENALDTVLYASVPADVVPHSLDPTLVQGTNGSVVIVPQGFVLGVDLPTYYKDPVKAAEHLKGLKGGTVTYGYIICADTKYDEIEALAAALAGSHVQLVDYRSLHGLVTQKVASEISV